MKEDLILLHLRKQPTQMHQTASTDSPMTSPDTAAPAAPQALAPNRPPIRKIVLGFVVVLVVFFGGRALISYLTHGRYLISTDDAYVGSKMSVLSPRVSGHIVEVLVATNQLVKAGDLLAKIDDGDYKLALNSAEQKIETQKSTLARIDRQIEQQTAVLAQLRAQISASEADAQRAANDFERAQKLAEADFSSRAKLDSARADRDRTQATLLASQANLKAAESGIDVLRAQKNETEHLMAELETAAAKARRDLAFTEIRAPLDGTVGNKSVEVGKLVQPGTSLMAIVPLDSVYVDANVKETQLGKIKPGMKAELHVDAFPDRMIEGKVTGVSPATGAQFSLLPPENATGNFTKIVQRVPVRIAIPAEIASEGLLRPGLSVVVDIDTRLD